MNSKDNRILIVKGHRELRIAPEKLGWYKQLGYEEVENKVVKGKAAKE